jgi:hypothetical protein
MYGVGEEGWLIILLLFFAVLTHILIYKYVYSINDPLAICSEETALLADFNG